MKAHLSTSEGSAGNEGEWDSGGGEAHVGEGVGKGEERRGGCVAGPVNGSGTKTTSSALVAVVVPATTLTECNCVVTSVLWLLAFCVISQ